MKRIFLLKDKERFKGENLKNWYRNTDLWLQGKMRHLRDIYGFTAHEIEEIVRSKQHLKGTGFLDLGCGEGWILRMIIEKNLKVDYVGIDFNVQIIHALQQKYRGYKNIRFECLDLEERVPDWLVASADIAVNFFNFFEIPNIEGAFTNVSKMLKAQGSLLVVSIDPVMQILAISKDRKMFIKNLKKYEAYQTELAYDKEIDVSGGVCHQFYRGVLYSTATYVELAKKNNLAIRDYKEVVKTGNPIPQIYQYIYFEKNG